MIIFIKNRPSGMKKKHSTTSFQKNNTSTPGNLLQPGPKNLAAIFKECGIDLSQHQVEQFWIYHGLLRHHNTSLNLTRIHQFTNMVLKLYVDSALPDQIIDLPSPLLDLGTGPGMPGIPLKIMRPDLRIFLAEGRAKRVAFLRTVIAELGLKEVEIVDRNITPGFDLPIQGVITRAVEAIAETMDRVQGCLSRNGQLIFMKGPQCDSEIDAALAKHKHQYSLTLDHAYRIGQTRHERRLVCFQRLDAPPSYFIEKASRRHKIIEITSEQNPRFKSLKKLLSGRGLKKTNQALLSGQKQVLETIDAFPDRCQAWITSGNQCPPPDHTPRQMQWLQLSDTLYKQIDQFGTNGPLLCLSVPPVLAWTPQEGFPKGCSLIVPFQDPENIGTAIRSAAAFKVSQVILLSESAHPYHPKALRASSGTTLHVTLRQGPALKELSDRLPIVALSGEGQPIDEVTFPDAFGLLTGLEGEGLPQRWRSNAVRIPIDHTVESLNAATATAIALYEWRRKIDQR